MLCYSTGSLPNACTLISDPSAVVDALLYWLLPTPFRGIEWVIRPEHLRRAQDAGFWVALRGGLEARGFAVRNVHLGYPDLLSANPHWPGLACLIPQQRSRRTEAALAAACIAASLGSPHLTLTSGATGRSGGYVVAPGDAFARPMPAFAQGAISPDFLEEWRVMRLELGRIVRERPKTVDLLLEQEPEMVLHSAWQIGELCHEFSGEVFANYDIGHGQVLRENIPRALCQLAPYLRNVHIEDIAGHTHKHLLFGQGDIDFVSVFATLNQISYHGDLTPDLYPFSETPALGLKAATAFLAQYNLN